MTLSPEAINRIVVRGTNWVGDAVMTIAALRELRRLLPDSHITLASRSWSRGLFDGADFIDDILISDERELLSIPKQARQWRKADFDLAVIFTNSFASALIPFLARIPYRVGYATESRGRLLNLPLPLPEWRGSRHELYYYLNIVRGLAQAMGKASGIRESNPEVSLTVSGERISRGQELLRMAGVNANRPIVALCPGSINSRAKRWPAERFAAVGDRLITELDANVVLIGSEGELEISQAVSRAMKVPPLLLTGRTSLSELVGLLGQSDLLITNDTGPAHIAAALGRKTLVIFGPTNPLTTRPFSELAELLREPPDCAPCMLRDCPIDHRCMTAITPDMVFQKARAMIAYENEVANGQGLARGSANRAAQPRSLR